MPNDLERARSALQALDPGVNRETWVRIGMAAKAEGLSLEEWTQWSAGAANFGGERDCAIAWKSFKDGGVTGGTLYHAALSVGWKDPAIAHRKPYGNGSGNEVPRPANKPRTPPARSSPAPEAPQAVWDSLEVATPTHAYIVAKNGRPDGLRMVPENASLQIAGRSLTGWLAVPAMSPDGTLRTIQFIPAPGQGQKLNMPGASFRDGWFVVGDLESSARVFVVEGIGQAWACWTATDCAAVMTFGAGRTSTIATALRQRYPTLPLVVVADRGKEESAECVAREVRGRWASMPSEKPSNYDANDYAREHGADALSTLLDRAEAPAMPYRLLDSSQVASAPPLRWLVRGVLPAEGLAAIFGASGSGKSFLALDLCAAVADGFRWFEQKVTAAPVVYLALEGEAGFAQRVKAWEKQNGKTLPSNLRFVMQPFALLEGSKVADLAESVIASGCAGGLLVVDTLNRAASGADENASADMGRIIDAAKELQSRCGGLVLLVHHSGKDASRGLRGHSSLKAALDACIEVEKLGNGREWRIEKAKDGSDEAAHRFDLLPVEVGRHDDGEPITSCVVVADNGPRQVRRPVAPKSGNQRVVWDALADLLKNMGEARPENAPPTLPEGKRAVSLDAAIGTIRERLTCDNKRKTERTEQALTALHARGLVRVEAGCVWIP